MVLYFSKMQGLGNDYVYIDCIHQQINDKEKLAKFVSNRHFGIGSDGLILIDKSNIADFKMEMFNPDGSRAEMCGNGIRCVGKFVYEKELTKKTALTIETLAGVKYLNLQLENNKVKAIRVDMGEPILEPSKIPVSVKGKVVTNLKLNVLDKEFIFTCISMGNPHSVTIVNDIDNFDVSKYGKVIEENPIFPNKTNVEFIQIIDGKHIKMRVWERGTGETLACGTGACATLVSCCLNELTNNKVIVQLLGGDLEVEWDKNNNHVYMTGPAEIVFEGEFTMERNFKL